MLRECQGKKFLQLLVRGIHEEPAKDAGSTARAGLPNGSVATGAGPFIQGVLPTRTVDALLDVRTRASQSKAAKVAGTRDPNQLPDHYSLLAIERGEDESGIKQSYRKLVLKWHPDKHPADEKEANAKIRLINNAYEILSNPLKR